MPTNKDLLTIAQTGPLDEHWTNLINQGQANSWDPAHGKLHLTNVALLTDPWGIIYHLNPRQRLAIRSGGFGHDIKRSPSEIAGVAVNDARESGDFVYNQMAVLKEKGVIAPSITDMPAVRYAVEKHDTSPWEEDKNRLLMRPQFLSERFREVLYLADKMEQIDAVPAVFRRSMFVAGQRAEVGDLSNMSLSSDPVRRRQEAFLQESVIRVVFVNPEAGFPKHVQDILSPIYVEQRKFIHALCKSMGINSTEALARLLLGIQDSEGRNVLDLRKKVYPPSETRLARVIAARGGITDEGIAASNKDSADSASETVLYLSSQWQNRDPKAVVEGWKPNGALSKRLQAGFVDYINGEWATKMQQRILQAAA